MTDRAEALRLVRKMPEEGWAETVDYYTNPPAPKLPQPTVEKIQVQAMPYRVPLNHWAYVTCIYN
jgi:hypothetical protein